MLEDHANDNTSYRDAMEALITKRELRKTLSELGVFIRNLKTGVGFPNYLWRDLGYAEDAMTEDFWKRIIHSDDLPEAMRLYQSLLSGEQPVYRITYRVRSAAGTWHWVINSGRVVTWDDEGRPVLFIGADVDITEHRRTEEELERAKAEAEEQAQEAETLRTAGAIVASTLEVEQTVRLVLDQALNVVPYDTAAVQWLRDDALEVIGGNGWEDMDAIQGMRIPYPGDNPHSAAIRAGSVVVIGNMEQEFPDFGSISGNRIRSWLGIPLLVHGEVLGLLALDSEKPDFFTAKHVRLAAALGDHVAVALHNARLYEQTRELAMTDSLTGVASRRSFFVQAEQALELAKRNESWISVIMADLDLFKNINDEFGHGTGDDAIRLAAAGAQEVLRRSDIIGRYGGEEFCVMLPETAPPAARTIAERLRARVGAIQVPGTQLRLSVSVGVVSVVPKREETLDAILDRADQAMYEAKQLGRNRVEVFGEGSSAR